jgi:hypothetical protein
MDVWFHFNNSFRNFVQSGKSDPGLLIEVLLDGKKHHLLIGDMSISGSVVKGQPLIPSETLVLRYRRIWSR